MHESGTPTTRSLESQMTTAEIIAARPVIFRSLSFDALVLVLREATEAGDAGLLRRARRSARARRALRAV